MTPPAARAARRGTATSAFGVGKRENHDARDFYRRFSAPEISDDSAVCHPDDRPAQDRIFLGDIRDRPETVAPGSAALVVTSPPYYSGKEYEAAIGEGHVPGSYRDYLGMLAGVLAACARALEPGGRMAVNVANLGRKPYRSLSADVIGILENDLGLLLRGEIIWRKGRGAAGNCAWGTYQRPGDPVLRDLTERVIVASKGRFDRAVPARQRAATGLPSEATIYRDEFLEATVDVWEIPPESAGRVGHPAPFPVELPQRLIELYTYQGDLVIDPFMGSGTTAVAALRTGRHFLGYDAEGDYVTAAVHRVEGERRRLEGSGAGPGGPALPAVDVPLDPREPFRDRAVREGRRATELARWALEAAGLTVTAKPRVGAGVAVDFAGTDQSAVEWLFQVCGSFSLTGRGAGRADTLWKALGQAAVLRQTRPDSRFVVLTAGPLGTGGPSRAALAAVTGPGKPLWDVIDLTDGAALARLDGAVGT